MFYLRLLLGFALGVILSGLLSTCLLFLLLLKLTLLLLRFLIATLGFGIKPFYFLFACLLHPLFLALVLVSKDFRPHLTTRFLLIKV